MALPEKELLEALASSRIMAAMITPAVLISACGTLIFSTSARLGRVFDRVTVLKVELEAVLAGTLPFPEERRVFLAQQMELQRTRATLIQKAMGSLYTATALFVAASLAIAINSAYGGPQTGWVPTLLALLGGCFLFLASALLLYESRFNLKFVNRQLDFIDFLQQQGTTPPTNPPRQ